MSITFHYPRFDGNLYSKIGDNVEVIDGIGHAVERVLAEEDGSHAIASEGFSCYDNCTHVFVTEIVEAADSDMNIGWTSQCSGLDPDCEDYPAESDLSGCCLWISSGEMMPLWVESVPSLAKEVVSSKQVVSILTIAEDGAKMTVQWIVDGTEGKVHDVTDEFERKGDQIFPIVVLCSAGQQIRTIPFSQLKSTSPKIEELRNHVVRRSPPSLLPERARNDGEKNEQRILQLRQRVDEGNRRLLEQKDKQIQELKRLHEKDLRLKRTEISILEQERSNFETRYELERAEHQKTRNLLHQSKQEMKDMEIHFLKEQNRLLTKESGQRRERQEDQFQIKQERSD